MDFTAADTADKATFSAIYHALDADSRHLIGPASHQLLVVPIQDDADNVTGGLWAVSQFGWLNVLMLVVPANMRRQGVGSRLMVVAEKEARNRGCIGMSVDTFSFQAPAFYEKLGFSQFGVLDDCPPGYRRLFFQKRFVP